MAARTRRRRAHDRPDVTQDHHRDDQVGTHGIPAELLEAPTIGAVRRARGITGQQARIVLAAEIVAEAQRQAAQVRLVGILDACRTGARVDVIARRLHALALRLDPNVELAVELAVEHEAVA